MYKNLPEIKNLQIMGNSIMQSIEDEENSCATEIAAYDMPSTISQYTLVSSASFGDSLGSQDLLITSNRSQDLLLVPQEF